MPTAVPCARSWSLPRWPGWGEDEWREMHARMTARPVTNHAFWDNAEVTVLEAYLVRFHQLALRFRRPGTRAPSAANVDQTQAACFHENWANAAKALRYTIEHLRSVFEPMDADTEALAGLKRAMLESRVIRAYHCAPEVVLEGRWFAGRRSASAARPVLMHERFDGSTHARRWIMNSTHELREQRDGCPLDEEHLGIVDRFTLETLKTAGLGLDWQLSVMMSAMSYVRRFWLRKWTCPRARRKPHCPRAILAAAVLIAAKLDGISVRRARSSSSFVAPQAGGLSGRAGETAEQGEQRRKAEGAERAQHRSFLRSAISCAMAPRKPPRGEEDDDEELAVHVIEALRKANGIWYTTTEAVVAAELELLGVINFDLCVHHVHAYVKSVSGALHVRVAELAWALATELYASDLIFLHRPADLAHAVLLAAHAHLETAMHQDAVVCSSAEAGERSALAVARWLGEREARRLAASDWNEGPQESPSAVRKQPSESKRALACVMQLGSGYVSSSMINKKRKACV